MIKGKLANRITWDDVCKATNGGYDVFRWELGKLSKTMHHPFRTDKVASASILCVNNIWLLKDFTGEIPTMNAVQFIERKYSLSFPDALERIMKDATPLAGKSIVDKVPIVEERETHIAFSSCKFDKAHHAYFNAYHLTEDFLRPEDVYRVKDWAVNRRRVAKKDGELTYAYYAADIDKVKILRINVDRKDKWRTNVPGNYIWRANKITEKCKKLMASKARKDDLVLTFLGVCSVSFQSESITCIEPNIDLLNTLGESIYINFGIDKQGWTESKKITDKFGVKYYNIPNKYLELDVNDTAELAKYNITLLETHLKQKGFL